MAKERSKNPKDLLSRFLVLCKHLRNRRFIRQVKYGIIAEILSVCSQADFSIGRVQVEGEQGRARKQSGFQIGRGHDKDSYDEGPASDDDSSAGAAPAKGIVSVLMEVRGAKSIPKLAARLSEIPGVVRVHAGDVNFASE
jgi:putative Mg2+ transporter-C (MgtC) family protein